MKNTSSPLVICLASYFVGLTFGFITGIVVQLYCRLRLEGRLQE